MSPLRSTRDWFRNAVARLDHQNKVWFAISSTFVIVIAVCVVVIMSYVKSSHADKASLKASQSALTASNQALAANKQALATANCVNEILALRQNPAATDSGAYNELWSLLGNVLSAPSGAPAQTAYQTFITALAKDNTLLSSDATFRAAHPLGQC